MQSIWRKEARLQSLNIFLFFSSFIFVSGAFPQKDFEKALAERRQILIAHLVEKESTPSFTAVTARYAANERLAEANRMLSQLLQQPSGDPVYGFNLIATYLFGQHNMPDSLREKVRKVFSANAFLRGDSEDNQLRYYATLLLAAQTWPEMPAEQWFNGKSAAENWREAAAFVVAWMNNNVTYGQAQFDSPELLPAFVACLELLHEYVADEAPFGELEKKIVTTTKSKVAAPNLRTRISMMLDLLLIDFALEQIDGIYAGAHSYDTEPAVYSPRQSANAALFWLYFGMGEMKPTMEALVSAMSGYNVSDAVYALATNRDPLGGYAHRERKRVRNQLRNSYERTTAVYKYAYITRDYILGSVQGGLLSPLQQHTWDLTYLSPQDPRPALFVMHPFFDPRELGAFFVDEPALLFDELNKFKGRYNQGDKLVGGSPYEQIFQHRNTLIALYNIPEKVQFGHISGFFSKGLQDWNELDADGLSHDPEWLFCRAGNTFIAFRPLQEFRVNPMEGGWRYISESRQNGVILEVSTPEESKNFEEFKRRILEVSKVDFKAGDNSVKVKYTTAYGDRMEFVYDGNSSTIARLLNDLPFKYDNWPIFDNPYIKYDETKRLLQVRVKNKWRALDFTNWTVSERAGSFTEELGR
ncbi:MAG: hypothetical protein ALAOOOJD_03929 [bacterium]|nr:hypothetical protein [bacterium]